MGLIEQCALRVKTYSCMQCSGTVTIEHIRGMNKVYSWDVRRILMESMFKGNHKHPICSPKILALVGVFDRQFEVEREGAPVLVYHDHVAEHRIHRCEGRHDAQPADDIVRESNQVVQRKLL